jgi:hypothetical protein
MVFQFVRSIHQKNESSKLIATLNSQFQGKITVRDTHLAPFANFPDISIKIDGVVVSESKAAEAASILDVAHIYIGFNLWDLAAGNYAKSCSYSLEELFFFRVLNNKVLSRI